MLSRVGALCCAALLALPAASPGAGADPTRLLADLIEAQSRLVESAREYRASLEVVLALQANDVERADALGRSRRELFERGLVSRREAEEAEAVARARARRQTRRERASPRRRR